MSRVLAAPLIALVRLYQMTLGAVFPSRCRFHPSCSHYAIAAMRLNGPIIGLVQTVWRLLRCGPWTAGGLDEPRRVRIFGRATGHGHVSRTTGRDRAFDRVTGPDRATARDPEPGTQPMGSHG